MIRLFKESVDAQVGSIFTDEQYVYCRYLEINETDFGAPLTISLTETVFRKTHLLCRLQIQLILFTACQEFA